jgi:hypothetical protein
MVSIIGVTILLPLFLYRCVLVLLERFLMQNHITLCLNSSFNILLFVNLLECHQIYILFGKNSPFSYILFLDHICGMSSFLKHINICVTYSTSDNFNILKCCILLSSCCFFGHYSTSFVWIVTLCYNLCSTNFFNGDFLRT